MQDRCLVVANSGSVSLSYDGDRRAAYLLLDDGQPSIRRVDYDIDEEIKALRKSGLPHADWVASTLRSAYPQMPRASSTA
jgi:diadenosine tetraphosphatase ApaH/serine/threonine PP2A family protein phosphatase